MLNTEDVKINTVQIEIKSMMVGKKQLTLSLMRQIIEEYLIDEETLQFKGLPWGHVNYFWGDDKHKNYPQHLNIIWQKGKELRRSVIQSVHRFDDHQMIAAHHELEEINSQIKAGGEGKFYGSYCWNDAQKAERLRYLREKMIDWESHIIALEYKRDSYIPRYNALIAPLHKLDHFYIAV